MFFLQIVHAIRYHFNPFDINLQQARVMKKIDGSHPLGSEPKVAKSALQ